MDGQITANFGWKELLGSAEHPELVPINIPDERQARALVEVVTRCVQPARDRFGPCKVTSGYRCPALNRAVGGEVTSQHQDGEAVDFEPLSAEIETVFRWCVLNLDFDQVILEDGRWIHISYRSAVRNRHQALTSVRVGGKRKYFPFAE